MKNVNAFSMVSLRKNQALKFTCQHILKQITLFIDYLLWKKQNETDALMPLILQEKKNSIKVVNNRDNEAPQTGVFKND